MDFLEQLMETYHIPAKFLDILCDFYESYIEEGQASGMPKMVLEDTFKRYISLVQDQFRSPYSFEIYHRRVKAPFDYYSFGNEFIRPIVDKKGSSILYGYNLDTIAQQLRDKENVVFFANHQSEIDPQIISLLLEESHPDIAEEMVFVAGERVIKDPLAIPLSYGRDLLCVYSKRHMENPPEEKAEKQQHNRKTMNMMNSLLAQGGKCIYVAPSGGRDRKNKDGVIEVAPFDCQTLEMFVLMAQHVKTKTHFYPMALVTYDNLPPPDAVGGDIGEERIVKYADAHVAFCDEVDFEKFEGDHADLDKESLRQARTKHFTDTVKVAYEKLMEMRVKPAIES
jgi:glycerol-3-phosphate O-acyltransferase